MVNPYPYWFGYPYWYSDLAISYPYGYWYPYPAYFGYYRHHNHFVWWGYPSLAYTHWFFSGHHHHHYHHLSNHFFDRHHHHHRHASNGFHRTVDNWSTWRDPANQHRGGGHGDLGERALGARARGGSGTLAARDSGAFFNRNQPVDRWSREGGWSRGSGRAGGNRGARDGIDRVAPGERGPSIGGGLNGRSRRDRGQVERPSGGRDARSVRANPASPDAEAVPDGSPSRGGRDGSNGVRSSRGRSREGDAERTQQTAPVFERPQVSRQPQQERGAPVDSRRSSRGGDRGRRDQPRFEARPAQQPPAAQQQSSPRERGEGWSRRGDNGGGRRFESGLHFARVARFGRRRLPGRRRLTRQHEWTRRRRP